MVKIFKENISDAFYKDGDGNVRLRTDAMIVGNSVKTTTSEKETGDITPALEIANVYKRTAQDGPISINAPIGAPVSGSVLYFIIKDNGVPSDITWDSTYKAIGQALPAATTANKIMEVIAVFDGSDWLTTAASEV